MTHLGYVGLELDKLNIQPSVLQASAAHVKRCAREHCDIELIKVRSVSAKTRSRFAIL